VNAHTSPTPTSPLRQAQDRLPIEEKAFIRQTSEFPSLGGRGWGRVEAGTWNAMKVKEINSRHNHDFQAFL